MKRIDLLNFYTKLRHWEYWPMQVVYFPIVLYWLWLSAKARSFFYFTAANPLMNIGGLAGESKWNTLKKLPEKYKPKTILISKESSFSEIIKLLDFNEITYPLIAKPNVGERGRYVQKIKDISSLEKYIYKIHQDFLIQEFINYPLELGVFYYRMPHASEGNIPSLVMKDMLKVIGNGFSSVEELMSRYPRARFQLKRFKENDPSFVDYIPKLNEVVQLEPIGNHCRGTTFLDANNLIDVKLEKVFDEISGSLPGFYYGRYDIKCKSIEDLKKGEGIKILEVNGVCAEPSHIYHPGFSIYKAYKVLFRHWKIMFDISKENNRDGFAYPGTIEGFKKFKEGIALAHLKNA